MNPTYTRLPGVRRTPVSKDTLWMADDHLLIAHSNRISEKFQRVYFKDVQAIIFEEPDFTQRKMVWGGISALLLITTVTLAFSGYRLSAIFPMVLLTLPLAMFLTIAECRCYAVTAIGRYRIGALRYRESAERALAILTPILMEAQKKEAPVAGPGPTEVL